MILIAGSTGLLGAEICRRLAEKGKEVRALARTTSDAARKAQLKEWGCELLEGNLNDADSLAVACRGVRTVISTASSTFSRQEGDSIQSVDRDGQLRLVDAAVQAGVRQFIYISFPPTPAFPNALDDAKRAVERRLKESGLNWTSLQANYFMEAWLSPAVGFDYAGRSARLYGEGENKTSWVSFADVARFAVACVDAPAARNRIIPVGGPEALSPLEVVRIFENKSGGRFQVEKVPAGALKEQWENAPDPLSKSFASLMLAYSQGWPMEMAKACRELGVSGLTRVEEYAERVMEGIGT